MASVDLEPQIEDLEVNIDELEAALSPLLDAPLTQTTSTLPLLDKAKIYVLASYAIESLLFSSLQISGVNAKEHAVFKELARLKGYFAKVKNAELGDEPKPHQRVDKEAAARFIKHGLSGNDRYDAERAERLAKDKAKAALKAKHTKFDAADENASSGQPSKKPAAEEEGERDIADEDDSDGNASNDLATENEELYGTLPTSSSPAKSDKYSSKKRKRGSASASNEKDISPSSTPATTTTPSSASGQKIKSSKRTSRREHKRQFRAAQLRKGEQFAEKVIPPKDAPRSHSETFKALLEGPLKKKEKKGRTKDK